MERENSNGNLDVNSQLKINSQDYWDMRFEKNWNDFGGMQQTEFFANLACEMFPEWFIREIRAKQYKICDMGCALGNGVDVLSKFLSVDVSGMDFSEEAIENAKELFPQYEFSRGDIVNLPDDLHYDVVFCSNVLEHFYNPWGIFKKLAQVSTHYIVLLVPFREKLTIDEHVYKFDTNRIPMAIDEFKLVYLDTVDGAELEKTYYPDQQILLIYSNQDNDAKLAYLNDVTDGIIKTIKKEFHESLKVNEDKNDELLKQVNEYEHQIEELERKNSDSIQKNNDFIQNLNNEINNNLIKISELNEQINCHIQNDIERQKQLEASQIEIENLKNNLMVSDIIIQKTLNQCNAMVHSHLFQFVHFINRFVYQGIKGEKTERKKFRRWFFSRLHRNGGDADRRYNPMFSIINILNSTNNLNADILTAENGQLGYNNIRQLSVNQQHILENNYTKYDVIILGVIDYDFRYQRPQHFASSFAENGHRVFYVNANYHRGSGVDKIKDNLYVVKFTNDETSAIYETDWSNNLEQLKEQIDNILYNYCIRDAITIVDYPNWVYTAEYLRNKYGFKMVTDYMDDFTGFLNPAEGLVKTNCIKLLKSSDIVIPSSQFLLNIAEKYNDHIGIVRNGTEFKHFNKAAKIKSNKEKKVIGYYGAVAHWFDIEKICYIAKNLPDCEVIIIGDVTEGSDKMKRYQNIKLLGEIPYIDLPKYLADFDVCLIPFDTTTDLIKATNPVKFYEYLSAGKKIVATEIPELEPYRDKYVYMTNDNKQFLEYVKLCLNGDDTLSSFEECIEFGQANDWQYRYEAFAELCIRNVPKVSIIVLTYNNLKLNKLCINSILNKTAYPRYELIIVDNQSTDGTVEYLKELDSKNYPCVRVILNDKNNGFAGGNNIGIRKSDGDYLVTLNNDTIVTRGWLTSLTKQLENDINLGMCGPVTNSIGNEAKIKVFYNDISTLERFAYIYTWEHMKELFANPNVLPLFCTMIKREVIEKCGLLDENYKVGMFEDDDYAMAVKKAGYELAIAEDAFIHHFDGASFKKLEDNNYRQIFEENKEKYEKKWDTKWMMQKYRNGVDWDSNIESIIEVPKYID